MSGPAVGLRLLEPREHDDLLAEVIPWLETFCEPVETDAGGDVAFWVRDSAALGLPNIGLADIGAFFLTEDDWIPAEEMESAAYAQTPLRGLVLGAGCAAPANRVLLGHLTLALARRLDALVDFDGLLGRRGPTGETGDAAQCLAEARALMATLPGAAREFSYETGDGGRCFRHIGDAEFLTAWLRHPEFWRPATGARDGEVHIPGRGRQRRI